MTELDSLKMKLEQFEQQLYYIETRLEMYEQSTVYTKIKNYIMSYFSPSRSGSSDEILETEMLLRTPETTTETTTDSRSDSGGYEDVVGSDDRVWSDFVIR